MQPSPKRYTLTLLLTSAALVGWGSAAGGSDDAERLTPADLPTSPAADAQDYPATDLFAQVVERYRSLAIYEDTVVLEQTTARNGELPRVEQTELTCALTQDGGVEVTTPEEENRASLGLGFIFDSNPGLADLRRKYDLWLAPHLGLRSRAEPLRAFREGIDEGFMPMKAERVTIDDQEMLRLDLHSGDGNSQTYRAKYELFINPQTLLIMRVRGAQLLPDGANLLTDYTITPQHVVTSDGEDVLDAVSAAM